MEPPPAPTERTSTDDARTVRSPTVVSRRICATPSLTRHTSVEVPPMSKVRRLSKPACRAIQSAPVTPPAGPLISRLTGTVSAPTGEVRPPSERRMCKIHVARYRAELPAQVAHVPGDDRADIGIADRRDRALVLLHFGNHLGGERDRNVGQLLRRDAAGDLLMRVVGVGIDQRNRERVDPFLLERSQRLRAAHPRRVSRQSRLWRRSARAPPPSAPEAREAASC